MEPEQAAVNKQDNMTNKQVVTQKIHINKIHTNPVNPGEDMMCNTTNNIHCIIRGALDAYKDCATAKIKQELLHTVV